MRNAFFHDRPLRVPDAVRETKAMLNAAELPLRLGPQLDQ
jgi:hypothetical protein